MAQFNLGNVVGLLRSITAPIKKFIIWAKTVDNSDLDKVVLMYYDKIFSAWTQFNAAKTFYLPPILGYNQTVPPVSPVLGDTYILGAAPTGVWVGKAYNHVTWMGNVWDFITPRKGACVRSLTNLSTQYTYDGTSWGVVLVPTTGGLTDWDGTRVYSAAETAIFGGIIWESIAGGNLNHLPGSGSEWKTVGTSLAAYNPVTWLTDNQSPTKDATTKGIEGVGNRRSNITYYVSATKGDTSKALKGSQTLTYESLADALALATDGDLVYVFKDDYLEENLPAKSNVIVYLEPGVRIIPPSEQAPCFSDLVAGTSGTGATNFRVIGRGRLLSKGYAQNDTTAIAASYPASSYYIEAEICRSVEAWNGATVTMKNTILDFEFAAYTGGTINFIDCDFMNMGRTDTLLNYGYAGNISNVNFENCYFEKNGVNTDAVAVYGYDGPEIMHIFPSSVGSGCYTNMTFNKCTIVQKRAGYDCIQVQSEVYDPALNSTLSWIGCKFYNVDLTKKSIVFTTDKYAATDGVSGGYERPATVGSENGQLKWFFEGNISNVDVNNVNTDYEFENKFEGVVPMLVNSNFVILAKHTTYDL